MGVRGFVDCIFGNWVLCGLTLKFIRNDFYDSRVGCDKNDEEAKTLINKKRTSVHSLLVGCVLL